MKTGKPDAKERFLNAAAELWPVARGSIALVRKPCIQKGCRACARGEKHPAFIFSALEKGRRKCLHVPKPLVPMLKKAVLNGRRLQELMNEAGIEIIRGRRRSEKE